MLKSLMNQYPNVSLRKLSEVAGISYPTILKASKKPIAGVAYNPDEVNYDALDQLFAKRDIDVSSFDWETLNEKKSKATLCKDPSQFNVGSLVYLRKHPTTPYEIIYKTETHIVIMLQGTQEPQSWSLNTFMLNGPSFEPRVEHAAY